MKKGLTEIVFILDRSGSMGGLEADTIGGFNGLIKNSARRAGRLLSPPCCSTMCARCSMTACRWSRWRK